MILRKIFVCLALFANANLAHALFYVGGAASVKRDAFGTNGDSLSFKIFAIAK